MHKLTKGAEVDAVIKAVVDHYRGRDPEDFLVDAIWTDEEGNVHVLVMDETDAELFEGCVSERTGNAVAYRA